MPDRIFGTDEELEKHFEGKDVIDTEFAAGHRFELTCKKCHAMWQVSPGENGEVPKAARNPLLAHAHAHNGGKIMRRMR